MTSGDILEEWLWERVQRELLPIIFIFFCTVTKFTVGIIVLVI